MNDDGSGSRKRHRQPNRTTRASQTEDDTKEARDLLTSCAQALLMLFEKQLAACVARTQQLLSADPTCCFPALVMACALVRLKQTDDAYDVLRRQGSLDAHLALVQLQLEQQQNAAALETLHAPVFDDIRLQPGFVSLVCFLQDQDAAVKGLLDAVARNEALAGYAGSYLLRVGKSEEAVDLLSTAIKNAHDDVKLLKSLITSCFAIGREVPVDVINQLPPVPALSAEQIAEYERAALSSSKQLKKKSDAIPESVTTEKKKKKKKKIRYPKGFDPANPGPPPDPERWLPRYERTKGRRRNQMTMKGPQGALPAGIAPAQGSGRSRANRVLEDKNVSDNQRQKVQAASGTSHKSKKGKKRR